MDNELLVKSIRELCKKNNIAISQLENELHFGAGLISRWVKSSPSIDRIIDIADYFHVSIDEVVGRTIKSNSEEFINTLYDMTINNTINWEIHTDQISKLESDERFYLEDDGFENRELFVSSYKNGFFLLYCQYDEEKGSISDIEIQIYIRSDKKSKAVLQEINTKNAYPLWSYIHTSFYGTLDEVKAEEFKNAFILNKSVTNGDDVISGGLNNVIDVEAIEKCANNPAVQQFMELYSKPEFQKMQQVISSPNFQAAIEAANRMKKYFNLDKK